MGTAFVRPEPHRGNRRYLDLALESVKTAPLRPRLKVRLAATDGPYAETKEKAYGGR